MNNNTLSLALGHKVAASHTGLEFHGELTFEEWSSLAPQIGTSLRCMAFVIGDWLVYGEDKFDSRKRQGRADPERYELACRATGIDYAVLRNYAYVSRRVSLSLRNDRLSWSTTVQWPNYRKMNKSAGWTLLQSQRPTCHPGGCEHR
jgi:hypothetical protein